jgi:phage host-nuclease inhibitor protein Gam
MEIVATKEGQLARALVKGELAEDSVLPSEFEIENAIILIKSLQDRQTWLKELKRQRAKSIDDELQSIEAFEERVRKVIQNTMEAHVPEKKSLDFPGIGKVQKRATKPNWEVQDEDAVIGFLEENGKKEALKTETSLVKKELNRICDEYYKANMEVPGVARKPAGESLSVSVSKELLENKAKSVDLTNLDELDSL